MDFAMCVMPHTSVTGGRLVGFAMCVMPYTSVTAVARKAAFIVLLPFEEASKAYFLAALEIIK